MISDPSAVWIQQRFVDFIKIFFAMWSPGVDNKVDFLEPLRGGCTGTVPV